MSEMNEMPEVSGGMNPEPKKNNNQTIIIAVVVVVLLCCCCAFLAGAWFYGDTLMQSFG
jgi:flagellar basal body-associated protein FliL